METFYIIDKSEGLPVIDPKFLAETDENNHCIAVVSDKKQYRQCRNPRKSVNDEEIKLTDVVNLRETLANGGLLCARAHQTKFNATGKFHVS